MGERWQDIEVSGRKVRSSDRGRVGEEEKKKSSEQDSDTRRRQTESKMTGRRYTQAKEDEKVTESRF